MDQSTIAPKRNNFKLKSLNLMTTSKEELKFSKCLSLNISMGSNDNFDFEEIDDELMDAGRGPSQIREYLFLGSEDHASCIDTLKTNAITAVLNVASRCPNYFESDTDLIYHNLDLQDHCEEDISAVFMEAFRFIDNVKSQGGRVLVHCQAGVSRSATIVTAYLMQTYKLSMDEALRQVKEKRKCAAPNFGFMLKLMKFDSELQQTRQ